MASVVFEPSPPYAIAAAGTKAASAHALPLSGILETCAVIGYIVCVAFSFALTIFVCFHGYLVTKGRTTIELYEASEPDRAARIAQYDLGAAANWRRVCGNKPLCWIFPVRAFIDGDGLSWPRNRSVDHDPLLREEP
eukprot:IDg18943t1